ncbi:ArsR/SmtB family transcription factor [Vibrio sp. VB16]|uniref:ArsR/SmtB family transcription factor n=1 Tax=Vibrio sp. VB16 TaxID=2785746 RepID=UPI00189CC63B|nr:metalloregulator ArsR/SmtB family transcription factor [Vibrio sp. VB16]UGA56619.1 metalloregulator ArsR/SmtB family transcription factor [Vibrio sp. VB16]
MVNYNEQQLSQVFSALSDPTRREMLIRLGQNEMSIADLSMPFNITKSAITKHVKVLENAGLLKRTIDGRVHHCRFDPEPLKQASDWMKFYERFWNSKFNALDVFLAKEEQS